jgi:hypothetical protein
VPRTPASERNTARSSGRTITKLHVRYQALLMLSIGCTSETQPALGRNTISRLRACHEVLEGSRPQHLPSSHKKISRFRHAPDPTQCRLHGHLPTTHTQSSVTLFWQKIADTGGNASPLRKYWRMCTITLLIRRHHRCDCSPGPGSAATALQRRGGDPRDGGPRGGDRARRRRQHL